MHDLIIRNGILIDGNNTPRRLADVAITHGKKIGRASCRERVFASV